ncbi:DNA alkylation repair protein [Dactylosporangium sp. CA-139066]|uniref:DNA alkylation repair protein n=1 Tax=Dactylosporangium sp. CA-139066 TaxID=3239930 RepID=UPI003D9150DD
MSALMGDRFDGMVVSAGPGNATPAGAGEPGLAAAAATLAAAVRAGVRQHADPEYVAGTVAARRPGKPVLGVRIPLLRGVVRAALRVVTPRRGCAEPGLVRAAATLLWHGDVHEDELAACMLLRLAGVAPTPAMLAGWVPLLDNWLSVDELGGVLGAAVQSGQLVVDDVTGLAGGSVWQRRLFLVALITPVRAGLDPQAVPRLADVLPDPAQPVRKAALWLITAVLKTRPAAAEQFGRLLAGEDVPCPLLRLLGPAAPGKQVMPAPP